MKESYNEVHHKKRIATSVTKKVGAANVPTPLVPGSFRFKTKKMKTLI